MTHRLIIGDSLKVKLPKESVQLIVTSPPYWSIKDYGRTKQIGFNSSYEDYIADLNRVWDRCYTWLSNGCKLVVNIGDQYLRAKDHGRYEVLPIRSDIIQFCRSIGFEHLGAIIWQKVTNTKPSGGAKIMGSYPYPRNGVVKLDYEFILLFKKPGVAPKPTEEQKELSKLNPIEWNTCFLGHWHISGTKQKEHPAMFPLILPERLIKMYSFYDETILDPFVGSGTTMLAAKRLGRNSIGIEINPKMKSVVESKVGEVRVKRLK